MISFSSSFSIFIELARPLMIIKMISRMIAMATKQIAQPAMINAATAVPYSPSTVKSMFVLESLFDV